MTPSKVCVRCGQLKPLTEFHIRRRSADERRAECKPCRAATRTDHRRGLGRAPSTNPRVNDNYILRKTDQRAAPCIHGAHADCGGFHWKYTGGIDTSGMLPVDVRIARMFGITIARGLPFWCDDENLGFRCVNPHHGPLAGGVWSGSHREVFGEGERGEDAGGFTVAGGRDLSPAAALKALEDYEPPTREDELATRWLAAYGFNDEGEPSAKVDREKARQWLRERGFEVDEVEDEPSADEALDWLRGDA